MFKVGDKVQTGVFVCSTWRPVHVGIVIEIIDSSLIKVDIGSLHDARPWTRIEQVSHCRLVEE